MHFYQRLPHPLCHLLKELLLVDGTDVNLLCDFLLKVTKIRHVGQMNDWAIYELMYTQSNKNPSAQNFLSPELEVT